MQTRPGERPAPPGFALVDGICSPHERQRQAGAAFPDFALRAHPGYDQFPILLNTSAVGQQSSLRPFAF
jgi:hypothetical protein